jgi:hypothetical protein
MDMWRAAAGDPYLMEKDPDEIPMFARFVERGLALPASEPEPERNFSCLCLRSFLRGLRGEQAPLGAASKVLPLEAAAERQ